MGGAGAGSSGAHHRDIRTARSHEGGPPAGKHARWSHRIHLRSWLWRLAAADPRRGCGAAARRAASQAYGRPEGDAAAHWTLEVQE